MTADLTTALISAVAVGAGLGVQSSVSPGPLQTLMISETLSNGVRSGWRAAFAPLFTDPIAMILALFIVGNVPNNLLAVVALVGAAFLCRIAWNGFQTKETDFEFAQKPRLSLATIWTVNMLNPNLWIFTFTVNALKTCAYYRSDGLAVAVGYLAAFWSTICCCNLGLVFLIGRLKTYFNARWLVYVNRALSVFLVLVALLFVKLALGTLGIDVFSR